MSLQGYKTFATKTDFLFDGTITAIVGPNGSGKSNIADAIRWVLGEQSYMTLRGKRTTDMIFAGGRNRSRAGMAQAILTLDNTNGWLPIDYIEIEIGRRAYRSGENEYILNGQKVRLKDVSELLANSGLAERTYTIIGQGLVDQALSLRPQERRALFEEAAGIGLYKSRRAETVRRLEETRLNLERVSDILAELTPRLRQLKRQASRTRNYDQIGSDLRHLLRIWYSYQWQREQEELTAAREASEKHEEEWRSGREATLELRKKIEAKRSALQASRDVIVEIENQREYLRDKLGAARQDAAVAVERKLILDQQEKSLNERIGILRDSFDDADHKLKLAREEAEAAELEREKIEEAIHSFHRDRGDIESSILKFESAVEGLGGDLSEIESELSRTEGQSLQIEERIAETTAGRTEDSNLSTLRERKEESDLEIQELSASLKSIKSERKESSNQLRNLQNDYQSRLNEIDSLESARSSLREAISGLEAKIEVLELQATPKFNGSDGVEISGQLMDYVAASDEYLTALKAALAHVIDAYVVENEQDLWRLVRQSQRENIDLSVVLPSSVHQESEPLDHPDIKIRLSDIADVHDGLESSIKKILSNVYLVDNEQRALAIVEELPSGTVLVTREGLLVYSGRLAQNPARFIHHSESNAREEVDNLQQRLSEKKSKLNELEGQVDENLGSAEDIRGSINNIEAEFARMAEEEIRVESSLTQKRVEINQIQGDIRRVSKEISQTEQTISKLKVLQKQTTQKIENLSSEKERISRDLAASKEALSNLPVEKTKSERSILDQQLQSARTIAAGRVAVVDSRQTTLDQVQEQMNRANTDLAVNQEQQKDLITASLQQRVHILEEEYRNTSDRLQPAKIKHETLQSDLEQLEVQIDKQQIANDSLEAAYTQSRINSSHQENKVQGLKERIQAELGLVDLPVDDDSIQSPLPIAEVVDVLPVVDELPDDIESSIQRLRGQLNRIGAINPEAPQEYQELQDRFDFLQEQVADLESTSKKLSVVIEELDDLTSKSFAETVEKVDREFRGVFTRLFGGGSAQLVLTDPDELAISGVDILARLPGRRAQNLALLSGGERALTAAALVFSLLKVSPTPFCVLDEVDAMLDEANINRFRDMLCELSERTQFVVITHNRGTIQVADNVYGISMGSDSSSQVISIKPESYISAAPRKQ